MKLRNKLLLGISVVASCVLSSCHLYDPIKPTTSTSIYTPSYNYTSVKNPYVHMEKGSETGEKIELSAKDVVKKIEAKDSFLLFVHSTTCGHCKTLDEKYITPLQKSTSLKVYSLIVNNYDFKMNRDVFIATQPSSNPAFVDNDGDGIRETTYVPLFEIYGEGELLDYTFGGGDKLGKTLTKMINAYSLLDENYVPSSGIVSSSVLEEENKEDENEGNESSDSSNN